MVKLPFFNVQRAITPKECNPELRFLRSAHCLILHNISVKFHENISNGFWPGLGLPRPKAIVVIPQNQPLPKHLRKKTSKSAKHACHYATKERPVKITVYLGLDIII